MSKIFTFTFFLLSWMGIYAQQVQPSIDQYINHEDSTGFVVNVNADCFLLGTFSDYMGRYSYVDKETQVDRYYPYERLLANFLDSFITVNYKTDVDTRFEKTGHSESYSKKIAKHFLDYYDDKGYLKDGILDNEEKMYSFLTGVFLRDGEHVYDKVYMIRIYNSTRDKEIYDIVKSLHCEKIIYRNYRGRAPSSQVFYFEATPRMIKYFSLVSMENKRLKAEWLNSVYGQIFDAKGGQKIKKKYQQHVKQIEYSLRQIFKD